MSVLDGLNPAQRQAAQSTAGPLLILAGAGSGKTRVLTYRIAYLICELGLPPWNLLAVTFTNKAAGEMRSRVEALVGQASQQLWIGTFHAICARLLRQSAEAFGLDRNFTIYDEEDRRALMRGVLEGLRIPERDLAPRAAIAQISRAKNAMIDPDLFAQEAGFQRQTIAQVYAAYEVELRRNHAFDFDDLIAEPVRQFQRHPEVLARYQERFHHVLIDEYQDTNRPQYLLASLLAARHRNLCVVGDDDQSIYQFRGADLRNILDFERDYPDAQVVRLEQNYRSTARILQAANAVIGHNRNRKGKELWTQGPEGESLRLVECADDRGEARFAVQTITRLVRQEGLNPGQVAVLYRTNAQSRALEEELQRSGLPYTIVGSIRFYERKEIKDALAYLRLLANPADDLSLLRVLNTPRRGIGETATDHLQLFAQRQELRLSAALTRLAEVPDLNPRSRRSMEQFGVLLAELTARRSELELPELGQEVLEESGYLDMLQEENSPEAEARRENLDQLLAFMNEFSQEQEAPTLEAFLEVIALMAPEDHSGQQQERQDAVSLMTLHSAKGLEFPAVLVCGMEENLFPTSRAVEEEKSQRNSLAIEEERRLFYVGITRAERFLWLTCARQRFTYGSLMEATPSRFLSEVPAHLLEVEEHETRPTQRRKAKERFKAAPATRRFFSEAPTPKKEGIHYVPEPDFAEAAEDFLAVGRWVLHPSWGRGKILARDGEGTQLRLSIRFGAQVKRVMVAYAQLDQLGSGQNPGPRWRRDTTAPVHPLRRPGQTGDGGLRPAGAGVKSVWFCRVAVVSLRQNHYSK
ncbi:MAG: UvrD-helicase domain-containing protein [Candidatus Latescibacteria bacterium]|nr:UvrD-helicase domain-containing protein [Candidatus Latescibacterota bacterium]